MTAANMSGAYDPATELAIGVDLGGTNVRLAVYRGLRQHRASIAAGQAVDVLEPVARRRELVGDIRDPESVAQRIAAGIVDLIEAVGAGEQPVPVGVGVAGMLRGHHGIVANAPNLHWRDVAFGPLLTAELVRAFAEARDRVPGQPGPVYLYNDVNAITYGEYAVGAAVGADDVLGVFVGTGIGAGVVAAGRLIEGASNAAGEIGHFKVSYGDGAPLCGCGLRGCIEAFVGGTHLQERVRRELASGASSEAVRLAGGDPMAVHPGHLDEAAADGDAYALDLYAELAPLLAATLGSAISLLNPGRLVLGGGMLSRTPVFREHVIVALQLAVNQAQLDALVIVEPVLGDDAGLVGSALLAAERHP